eukprot:GILI01010422.1.p1 GENE.GILI01010422.1~~GILI01010422.1.p1  ORF type:complete len:403 (-),score=144.64 GILI01010422.1:205-1365(-)
MNFFSSAPASPAPAASGHASTVPAGSAAPVAAPVQQQSSFSSTHTASSSSFQQQDPLEKMRFDLENALSKDLSVIPEDAERKISEADLHRFLTEKDPNALTSTVYMESALKHVLTLFHVDERTRKIVRSDFIKHTVNEMLRYQFDFNFLQSKVSELHSLSERLKSQLEKHRQLAVREQNAAESKLVLRIIEAHHVPKMDVIGSADPYVTIYLTRFAFKTAAIDNCLHPVWNETAIIPLDDVKEEMGITLWDKDRMSQDEVIADLKLPVSSLVQHADSSRDKEVIVTLPLLFPTPDVYKDKPAPELTVGIKLEATHAFLRDGFALQLKMCEDELKEFNRQLESCRSKLKNLASPFTSVAYSDVRGILLGGAMRCRACGGDGAMCIIF